MAGHPELDALSQDLSLAEEKLQELVSVTSVDFLSAATRSLIDKALLVSAIGIAVTVLGTVAAEATLGPLKLTIQSLWVVPASAMLAIAFYSAGLLLMAVMDHRRWEATYNLKVVSIAKLLTQLRALQAQTM